MSIQHSAQPAHRSDIGVFWELSAISDCLKYPRDDLSFSTQLGLELITVAGSLKNSPDFDVSLKVFVESHSLSSADLRVLEELGFEVVDVASRDHFVFPDIGSHILMWLWDRCRGDHPASSNPTIVVVTSDHKHLVLLQMLKARGVFVILLSELLRTEYRSVCVEVANLVIDADNFEPAILCSDFQYYSSQFGLNSVKDDHINAKPPSFIGESTYSKWGSPVDSPVVHPSKTTSLQSSDMRKIQNPPGLFNRADSVDPDTEQSRQMRRLDMSRNPRDVLRSDITFRSDPLALSEAPDDFMKFGGSSDANLFSFQLDDTNAVDMYLQKGVPEELTYEQQHMQDQLVTCFRQKNIQLTVSTLRKIYTKQCRVFRIPVVLASVMPVLTSYVEADPPAYSDYVNSCVIFTLNCIQWSIGAQKNANSESFKYKMNKKISQWLLKELVKKGVPSQCVPDIMNVALSVVQNILKHVMELELSLEILEVVKVPSSIDVLLPFVYQWIIHPDPMLSGKAREFASQHGISLLSGTSLIGNRDRGEVSSTRNLLGYNGQGGGMGMGIGMTAGMAAARPYPSMRVSSPMTEAQDALMHQRLIFILKKYADGILVSRVPLVYREEFGEILRIQGQKLKELLLALGGETAGEDGPGDKIFVFSIGSHY